MFADSPARPMQQQHQHRGRASSFAPCLTLHPPWAWLIGLPLGKWVETRGWQTGYRGPLLLHVSKAFPPEARATLFDRSIDPAFYDAAWRAFRDAGLEEAVREGRMPLGAITHRARLTDCIPTNDLDLATLTPPERLFGNYRPDRFAWVLEEIVTLPEPVPCPGKQMLWAPGGPVLQAVRAQIGAAA